MTIYELNAATIYSVAHDASMTEDERRRLIAQLLKLMACDTPADPSQVQPASGG